MSDTYYDQGSVRRRSLGRFASLRYANELRDWIERRYPLPQTGNADLPFSVASTKLPTPEHQGQFYGGVTQNQTGFSYIFAVALPEPV